MDNCDPWHFWHCPRAQCSPSVGHRSMGREVLAVLLAFDPPAGVLEEVGPGDGAREEGKAAPGAVEERNVFRRMLAKVRFVAKISCFFFSKFHELL